MFPENRFHFFDERPGARSCRNFRLPSGNAFHIPGMTFFQLHQCICINSSYPQSLGRHKWTYSKKAKTFSEHLIMWVPASFKSFCKSKRVFLAYLLQFSIAVWAYSQTQCSESLTMRIRFLDVISALKNHWNSIMDDSQPGVDIRN